MPPSKRHGVVVEANTQKTILAREDAVRGPRQAPARTCDGTSKQHGENSKARSLAQTGLPQGWLVA